MLRYSQAAAESASERFEALFANVPLSLMVLDAHDMVVQANSMAQRSFQPQENDRPLIALMPFVGAEHAPRVRAAFAAAANRHGRGHRVVFHIDDERRITGDLHIARIESHSDDGIGADAVSLRRDRPGPLLAERQVLCSAAAPQSCRSATRAAAYRRAPAGGGDQLRAGRHHLRRSKRAHHRLQPTAAMLFQCAASDALGSPEPLSARRPQVLAFAQLTTQAALGEMTGPHGQRQRAGGGGERSFERHAEGETTTVFARDLTGRKREEARRNCAGGATASRTRCSRGHHGQRHRARLQQHPACHPGQRGTGKADCTPAGTRTKTCWRIDKAGRRAARPGAPDPDLQPQRGAPAPPPSRWPRWRMTPAPAARHPATEIELRPAPAPELPPGAGRCHAGRAGAPEPVHQRRARHWQSARAHPGRWRAGAADQHQRENLGLAAKGDYVALRVRDDRPGMDEATLPRIFDPSSPPSPWARAQAWAWPWCMA